MPETQLTMFLLLGCDHPAYPAKPLTCPNTCAPCVRYRGTTPYRLDDATLHCSLLCAEMHVDVRGRVICGERAIYAGTGIPTELHLQSVRKENLNKHRG